MPEELVTDVLVIGYGGAGASAAITAHDAGADVVVLEKLDEPGGNTRWSNSSWFCPPPGTEQQAVEHIDLLCLGRTDRSVIEAYVAASAKTKEWIEGLGGTSKVTRFLNVRYPQVTHPSWPNFPGAAAMINHTVMSPRDDEPNGERLFQLLADNVKKRGIKTFLNTRSLFSTGISFSWNYHAYKTIRHTPTPLAMREGMEFKATRPAISVR